MASVYAEDELTAAALAGSIADNPGEMLAGTGIKTTDSTTIVVAHSFAAAPDFVLFSSILKPEAEQIPFVANTTSVTWTRDTTATSWTLSYIIGYTA